METVIQVFVSRSLCLDKKLGGGFVYLYSGMVSLSYDLNKLD